MDRRCCAYDGMGLSKPDKVALTNVSPFKPGDNLHKWMESIWTCILLYQGGDGGLHRVHGPSMLRLCRHGTIEARQLGSHKCITIQARRQAPQVDGVNMDLHPSTSRRRRRLPAQMVEHQALQPIGASSNPTVSAENYFAKSGCGTTKNGYFHISEATGML